MVKLINCSLPVATSVDLHISNPLFTDSLKMVKTNREQR